MILAWAFAGYLSAAVGLGKLLKRSHTCTLDSDLSAYIGGPCCACGDFLWEASNGYL